jgi:gamma-glutamyltranspeptidase/glutathione hydrolase
MTATALDTRSLAPNASALFIGRPRRWLVGLIVAGTSLATQAASIAPVPAEHGMVVTAQHLATRVGVEVLEQGGNAVDAAVAVGYALAVVYPAAGNLGGGGFMTLRMADGRETFIDYRETAPYAAHASMFLHHALDASTASRRGHLAAGIPGSVAGHEYARERYGRLPRAQLLAPAIRLAREGFVLRAGDVEMLRVATEDFRRDPASAAIFLKKNGEPLQIGDRLRQPDLARTLQRISRFGAAGFYQGPIAQRLVSASREGGGRFTQADFDGYRVRERAPIACDYRGYRIVSAPPPSSGGVLLCQMLKVLQGYPLNDWGFRSAQSVHHQIEAMRHAFADRNRLGDPDFVTNPVDELLSEARVATIRSGISPLHAGAAAASASLPTNESGNTTHYSIADRWGNVASVTTTLNGWFGARVTVPGTGVLLNNEMDDFNTRAGVPNMYGLVQGEANAIAPGKRPLSSMTPTVVTRDGQPVAVLGTPGGSRIITVVLHTLVNLVDHGMTAQEAVDAPRFHFQGVPATIEVEPFALSPDTRRILEGMGHRFGGPQPANHAAVVLIGAPSLGGKPQPPYRYFGANDPRRNTGLALGQ